MSTAGAAAPPLGREGCHPVAVARTDPRLSATTPTKRIGLAARTTMAAKSATLLPPCCPALPKGLEGGTRGHGRCRRTSGHSGGGGGDGG